MTDRFIRILLIEDDQGDARLIKEMLNDAGMTSFDVVEARTLKEGLRGLQEQPLDIVVLDLGLPDSQGLNTLKELFPHSKGTAVVVLTGLADETAGMLAVQHGAQDYLIKGQIDGALLGRAMRYALERKRSEQKLQQSYEKLKTVLEETVHALASAVGKRDPYTASHQIRVTELACAIAEEMGLSKDLIDGLRIAGLLHDIGKIAVPTEILSKPTKLTQAEFSIVKTHSQVGCDIIKSIEFPWPVAQIVLQHHEKLNGSGYPRGLRGNDILLEARILSVADVVEAMASHRPYRPSLGLDVALNDVASNQGTLYDPNVVKACLDLINSRGFRFTGDVIKREDEGR